MEGMRGLERTLSESWVSGGSLWSSWDDLSQEPVPRMPQRSGWSGSSYVQGIRPG